MNKKIRFWALVALIVLISTGCSTKNNSGQGSGDSSKPQPQVRVEALPSATPTLPALADNSAPTPEPSVSPTPGWIYYDPTPDEDALASQIQSMMDDIDRKLRNSNFVLK